MINNIKLRTSSQLSALARAELRDQIPFKVQIPAWNSIRQQIMIRVYDQIISNVLNKFNEFKK